MFHDAALTEEQQMIRRFVVQLSGDFDNPYFLEHTRNETFPHEFWDVLVKNGFLGFEAEEAYGGSGFGLRDLVIFLHGLGEAGLASYHLLGHLLSAWLLTSYGDDAQKERLLPELVEGKRWGIALVEDTRGRELAVPETTARANGDGFTLTGRKPYVSCADELHRLIVPARTDDNAVRFFIVDPHADGVEIVERDIGVRVIDQREPRAITGDRFCHVDLDGVTVAAQDRLDGELLDSTAARMLLMLAAVCVGWGDRVIDQGVAYANERVLYRDPIAAYQAIQHPMVRAKTDVEMAKLLVERAVDAYDDGNDLDQLRTYASVAKHASVEAAMHAFDIAMQCHGGSAFDRETGLITLWPLVLLARPFLLNKNAVLESFGAQVLAAS